MKYEQTRLDLDTLCGKMCREHSVPTQEKILGSSSKKSAASKIKPCLYLDLRSGLRAAVSWETGTPSLGEYSTHSFGESPNAVVESHLSQILEESPHPKYFLSERACLGVLRRAEKRGKELPKILKEALEKQSASTTLWEVKQEE